MSSFAIPEDTDVTKFYLRKVLEQKAPALGSLHKAFMEINIDRVLQSFIDSVVEEPGRITDPSRAMFFAGQMDMAMRVKKFLCNLNNISMAIDDGDVDIEELIATDAISSDDLALAAKYMKRK